MWRKRSEKKMARANFLIAGLLETDGPKPTPTMRFFPPRLSSRSTFYRESCAEKLMRSVSSRSKRGVA